MPQVNPRKEEKEMSKMAEMDQTIRELRDAAAAINSAADWLYQMFSGSEDEPASDTTPEVKPEPEKKPLALEDVRAVLADKSRAGHTAEIRELLQKYGANKLSAVDPSHYEALLKDVEALS